MKRGYLERTLKHLKLAQRLDRGCKPEAGRPRTTEVTENYVFCKKRQIAWLGNWRNKLRKVAERRVPWQAITLQRTIWCARGSMNVLSGFMSNQDIGFAG